MLKRNKLLLGILVLLLVLSVGYALFSEKIVIDGTIKATGDFEITADCEAGYGVDLVNAGVASSTDYNQNGFEGDTCLVDGTNVTLSTGLKYPGARRYFTVKMTNTGVVGAKLVETVSENKFYVVDSSSTGSGIKEIVFKNPDGTKWLTGSVDEYGVVAKYKNEDVDVSFGEGTPLGTAKVANVIDIGVFMDGNYCSYKDSCFENFSYIDVSESIYYIVEFNWPEDFAESNITEFTIDYKFSVPFEQITLSEQNN